jgi:hypothetical protein
MAGEYDWFYSASPEQQQAYLAQGMVPPDYAPVASPSVSAPLITFNDQGQMHDADGVTNFGEYLASGMTPDQLAEYQARGEVDQEIEGGTVQAPTLAYRQPWTPQRVAQEKADALSEYQQVWNQVAEDEGHQNVGSDPRVKAAADRLDARNKQADLLGQYGGDGAYQSPERRAASQTEQRILDQDRETRVQLKKLQNLADEGKQGNQQAVDEMGRLIDAQDPLNAAYVTRSRELADELGGYRDTANNMSLDALGEYAGTLRDLNNRNDALMGGLGGVYGDLATPIQGNLTSQAAIADPAALAAQNEALGFFQGGMNGALDYQSAAARAYADPKYVAMRDQGLADLYDVSQGSKDVSVGEADPAAYAAAMQSLQQASDLTNPAVTDQENFLYEQARQRWESEMRGVAQAKMSDLRRRGMSGGGLELTSHALTNADVSQKRVLADLAASAGAVERAGEMLKLKGALSTSLNDAGNMLATGNANRQLQALGLYQQGAETAQQSSFDQEYKRGVAQDNASANNQQTRLQSGIAYGNQANAMQDDAFARGQAADNMNVWNKEFEASERDALWGRTTDYVGLGLNANAQNSNNATNIFQGTTSVANNNYVRDRDFVQGKDLASQREWAGQQGQLDRRLGVQGQQIGINNTNTATQGAVIGQNIAAGQWTTGNLLENDIRIAAGDAAKRAALDSELATIDAEEEASRTGIAGLPIIGSKKGALNLFGIFDKSAEEKKAEARARYGV